MNIPTTNQITCPNCGHEINVSDVLRHQIEEQIRNENDEKLRSELNKIKEREKSLSELAQSIQRRESALQEAINNGVRLKLAAEKQEVERKVRGEFDLQFQSMQRELHEKSQQVIELNNTKVALAKAQRDKAEAESRIRSAIELEKTTELNAARKNIRTEVEKEFELRLKDKDLVIDQMRDQVIEAQKKAEQGSSQRHGEVQELAIEEFLRATFRDDDVEEVKKGDRGADCLQIVNTRMQLNCGRIYYESKRTKEFRNHWIPKFKEDMRVKGALFGVLVTDAMPKDIDCMTQIEGIWVCSYQEFKALCHVLRDAVIRLSLVSIAQENKGEKMSMLYDFLTGNKFRSYVEAIVESFVQMKNDLDSERRSIERMWNKRNMQIEKVLRNTSHMYGDLQGIAGSAIKSIDALELSYPVIETRVIENEKPQSAELFS